MSLVINNNMMAATATRNLGNAYGELGVSTRRLSSGLRVGTAADDAAGLAVRELMRAEVTSLNQGIRNANDAISMIQTADGALGVIDEKLIRMKELAQQAATGTYNSDQRLIIDSEYQAMASEVTRIANSTDFNGIYLLNGAMSGENSTHSGTGLKSTGPLKVHFGTGNDSAEDYYYVSINTSTASALGLGLGAAAKTGTGLTAEETNAGKSISTQALAQASLSAINDAIISKDKIRANLGGLQNRLSNTISTLQIQAENMQAAESQISDVDVAQEMTTFVKNQILTQAAVSMLSQANNLPRMALSLIG